MISIDKSYSTTRLVGTEPIQAIKGLEDKFEAPASFTKCKGGKCEGGLRTMGYSKRAFKMLEGQWWVCDSDGKPINSIVLNVEKFNLQNDCTELPIITIVTVVYNGEKFLEATIQSVINQSYLNIEYIIIDGGSSDGTLDIIRQYEHAIDYWVSEKDAGIYDAMNKGISASSGKWINFMNAGDGFFSIDTITLLFNNYSYTEDVIYGKVLVKYPNFSRIQRSGKIKNLWRGMQFCHQSAFVKTKLHKISKFNITNRIAADLEFFYGVYKNGATFRQVDAIFSTVLAGGLSDTNRVRTILGWSDAVSKHNGSVLIKIVYCMYVIDFFVRSFIKKILPKKAVQSIIRMKK